MSGNATTEMVETSLSRLNRVSGINVKNLGQDHVESLIRRSKEKEIGDLCSCGGKFIRMAYAFLPVFDDKGEVVGEPVRVTFPECAYSCFLPTPS